MPDGELGQSHQVIRISPEDTRRIAEDAAKSVRDRELREEQERQEQIRREQGVQGVCPHCGGELYLLKIMEPFTTRTVIGSRLQELRRFYTCHGDCKTVFWALPKQPDEQASA